MMGGFPLLMGAMQPNLRNTVGIDIGTTKVVTLIAEERGGTLELCGVGHVPSQGMKKGMVVDIEKASQALRQSVLRAEEMAGIRVERAWASVGGSHIRVQSLKVARSIGGREVLKEDISQVVGDASGILLGEGREVLHVLPRGFRIDGQGGIMNPIGMIGVQLELDATVVTAQMGPLQNIRKLLENSGVKPIGLMLQPLASAEAVLRQEEKDLGVILVDIGGGTSDVMVYADGAPRYVGVVGLGGAHITRDIAAAFKIGLQAAERLKREYGCTSERFLKGGQNHEEIELVLAYDEDRHPVSIEKLCLVIEARVREILELVQKEIDKGGIDRGLCSGLVLCGGSSLLRGLKEAASELFCLPVRIGIPAYPLKGPFELVAKPGFATGVGLLAYARLKGDKTPEAKPPLGLLVRIKQLLKEARKLWGRTG